MRGHLNSIQVRSTQMLFTAVKHTEKKTARKKCLLTFQKFRDFSRKLAIIKGLLSSHFKGLRHMMCHHRNAVHYTHELQSSVLCFLNINHRTARHSLTTATNSQHICMYVKLKFLAWNTRPVAPLIVSPPTGHTAPCAAPTRRHRLISHESLALQMLLF